MTATLAVQRYGTEERTTLINALRDVPQLTDEWVRLPYGWEVSCGTSYWDSEHLGTRFLGAGEVAAEWERRVDVGVLMMPLATFRLVQSGSAAINELIDLMEEARTVPKAVVTDVSVQARLRGQAAVERSERRDGLPPGRSPHGIAELALQLRQLVEDMSRFERPDVEVQKEFARRYAHCRDRMALLRRQFAEAEGAFEVVQARLRVFLED